jgi:hypothetical protein
MVDRRTIRITFTIILVLIAISGGALWQGRPVAWSAEKQLTHGSGDSRLVDLMTDPTGNVLHLAWEDTRGNATEVYYKRSLDDGVTWGPDIRLSNLSAGTVEPEPRIGTDGKTVLIFFSNRTPAGEHIFYASSTDAGTDFSVPMQLTHDPGDQSNAAVAFIGPTVHLVYQDYLNNGDERVFYTKSSDAGLNWEQKVALTDTTGAQDRYVAIAAVNNEVFVTWCRFYQNQEAVYVRASLDSGASWEPETQASDYRPPSYQEFPDIASNGTEVYVVWVGQGIQYSHSSDSGLRWSNPISITNTTRQYLAPRLTAANSKVQVVAAAISTIGTSPRIEIDSDVYYLSSSDGGQIWTKPSSLTTHKFGALSLAPVIRSRGASSFVAWEDNRNGRLAIFFLSKPDFAVLGRFEWQVIASTAIGLVVTIIVYSLLDRRSLRTHQLGKIRKHRPRSRARRSNIAEKRVRRAGRIATS